MLWKLELACAEATEDALLRAGVRACVRVCARRPASRLAARVGIKGVRGPARAGIGRRRRPNGSHIRPPLEHGARAARLRAQAPPPGQLSPLSPQTRPPQARLSRSAAARRRWPPSTTCPRSSRSRWGAADLISGSVVSLVRRVLTSGAHPVWGCRFPRPQPRAPLPLQTPSNPQLAACAGRALAPRHAPTSHPGAPRCCWRWACVTSSPTTCTSTGPASGGGWGAPSCGGCRRPPAPATQTHSTSSGACAARRAPPLLARPGGAGAPHTLVRT